MQMNDPDINYVITCAKESGIKVDKNTVMDFHFIAEVMRAMNRKIQPYEDCISRSDVEKEFIRWRKNGTTVYTFHKRIMELPPVKPTMPVSKCDCSKCDCSKCDKGHSGNYSYCPNCGEYKEGENK